MPHSFPGHSRPILTNTGKLELPSISQVHTRGPVDVPWFNPHYSQRPLFSGDRLPNLHLPQSYASSASYGPNSSRIGLVDSSSSGHSSQYPSSQTSSSSYTTAQPAIGLRTPSPSPTSQTLASQAHGLPDEPTEQTDFSHQNPSISQYTPIAESYSNTMNQPQYLDSHQPHMSAAQSYAPQPTTASSMPHYPHYQQQPSVLQPGPGNYAPSPGAYGQYGYSNGVTSPQSAGQPVSSSMGQQMNSGLLPLPAMPAGGNQQHTYISGPGGPTPGYPQQNYDTTGQVAPPGMKPRVTATLWEDEGSMCFQVEAKGVCVARRDDNHMINGTKLLNVAGMTRGRRDGILKSEKLRHVVKIGPMHLKGVWIPFERALDFANKEKITELLYPLFVHNIGALLYHPTNSNRTNAVMAAAERRKLETKQQQQGGILAPPGSQPPSLHHHHSMTNPVASHVSQPPHSIAPHPGSRPNLDRAHTFPTPPTSASSTVGMNAQGQYDSWGQNLSTGVQSNQPLAIDTHAHSTPNTPATTPPGPSMAGMQTYQGQQPYDSSRPLYSSATTQQAQYAPQQTVPQPGMARLNGPIQANPYLKHEMGPPTARAPGSGPDMEHGDHKAEAYTHSQGTETVGHGTGEEEAEHEHDSEYPHENNAAYNTNRSTYNNYNSAPNLGSLPGEHAHLSPEMSGSPPHQNGSGRVTPRTSTGSQPQWGAAGYHTPPRASASSNQYPSISDARATVPNGTSGTETYAGSLPPSYAPLHVNGTTSSNKRMREDEDQDHQSRPASRGDDIESLKRRKLAREGSVSGANNFERDARPINRARAPIPPQTPQQQQQQQQRRGR